MFTFNIRQKIARTTNNFRDQYFSVVTKEISKTGSLSTKLTTTEIGKQELTHSQVHLKAIRTSAKCNILNILESSFIAIHVSHHQFAKLLFYNASRAQKQTRKLLTFL